MVLAKFTSFRLLEKEIVLHSEFQIPVRLVPVKANYKYALLSKSKGVTYEDLEEFRLRGVGGHVNRCLLIGKEDIAGKSE